MGKDKEGVRREMDSDMEETELGETEKRKVS